MGLDNLSYQRRRNLFVAQVVWYSIGILQPLAYKILVRFHSLLASEVIMCPTQLKSSNNSFMPNLTCSIEATMADTPATCSFVDVEIEVAVSTDDSDIFSN